MNRGFINFREEAKNIKTLCPKLTYAESEVGIPFIYGELELKDDADLLVDSYFIRIQPTSEYPLRFPHVFETNGRIPANIDWHVYSDGHCCIKAVPEEAIICRKGITLKQFIHTQLVPYFFNQRYRELYGFFLKERSHGDWGSLEYFEDVFKTSDLTLIGNGLLFIKSRKEPKRTSDCFCKSGKKYRKCHREAFRSLQILNDEELEYFIKIVIKMINT